MAPISITVEGNISSGKSTFIELISRKRAGTYTAFTEPVEEWRNFKGHNLLGLMYADPAKWALPFQTYVVVTMQRIHETRVSTPAKLMERSIFSAQNIFTKTMVDEGTIDAIHSDVIEAIIDQFSSRVQIDRVVYIRTSPEVAYERLVGRGRLEESGVTLEYLRKVHEKHEDWLMRTPRPLGAPQLVVIDGNRTEREVVEEYCRMFNV